MTLQNEIGKELRKARTEQGMTQEQVFRASGIDAGHQSRIESGRILPKVGTLLKLAQAVKRRLVITFE